MANIKTVLNLEKWFGSLASVIKIFYSLSHKYKIISLLNTIEKSTLENFGRMI